MCNHVAQSLRKILPATVCGGMRHKNAKPIEPDIKSAWMATKSLEHLDTRGKVAWTRNYWVAHPLSKMCPNNFDFRLCGVGQQV